MSLYSFTALALSSRKRRDLDLRLSQVFSLSGLRSSGIQVAASGQTLVVSASRQRCRRLPSAVHPLPTGPRRMEGATERTIPACRLRIRRILLQTPSGGCFRKAPSLLASPMSHSVTRSVLVPRPAALGVLLRTTTPAGQVRTCRGPRQNVRPAGLGFQRKNLPSAAAPDGTRFFLRSLPESTPAALGSGAPRVASRKCPE